MKSLNIISAKDIFDEIVSLCIKNNDVVRLVSEEGNVVLLSEDDYRSLLESLYLAGIKGVYEDIEEVTNASTDKLSSDLPWD